MVTATFAIYTLPTTRRNLRLKRFMMTPTSSAYVIISSNCKESSDPDLIETRQSLGSWPAIAESF
jgi:hypothetical protein